MIGQPLSVICRRLILGSTSKLGRLSNSCSFRIKKNSTYITIVNSLITLNENKIGAITTESKLHDFEAMSTLQNAECILSMKLRWVDLIK